jgi:hypothetical protein
VPEHHFISGMNPILAPGRYEPMSCNRPVGMSAMRRRALRPAWWDYSLTHVGHLQQRQRAHKSSRSSHSVVTAIHQEDRGGDWSTFDVNPDLDQMELRKMQSIWPASYAENMAPKGPSGVPCKTILPTISCGTP